MKMYFRKNKTVSRGKHILILAFLIVGFISTNSHLEADPLPSIQAMWDQTIKYHQQGMAATTAMQLIWMNRCPQATPDDLAKIFSAVYADTYWAQTYMDQGLMASIMSMTTGLSMDVCKAAAKNAFSVWCGILVRKNFSDFGTIPVQGNLTFSPDVVRNGPLTRLTLIQKWSDYIWNPGGYCYTRGQNLGFQGSIKNAMVRMFYTDLGFICPPTSWNIMYTQDNEIWSPLQGITPGPLKMGERAASGAFIFSPAAIGHFCLISVVSTEFFKNDPTTIPPGNWNSYQWITNNGAAGWHNTDVNTAADTVLKFYNQDGRPETFVFEAHCYNVPVGTKVALKCRDPGADELDSGEVNIIHKQYQLVSIEAEVPANYKGDLLVRIKGPGGKLLPAGASVVVRQLWLLEHGHKYYLKAAKMLDAHDAVNASQVIRVPMGNCTIYGAEK